MINRHYLDLKEDYLFAEIDRRVQAFQEAHPERKLIRLGIGDVTRPLCPCAVEALRDAAREMGEQVRGYGPYQGYAFLREAVAAYYAARGTHVEADDVFVSDGAKNDLGNILDIFDTDLRVLIPDPVYPVYVDTNRMAGRPVSFLRAEAETGFLPLPEAGTRADIVYLCSPNNPTGAVYSLPQLARWVEWAHDCGAVILFDAAYEAFVREEGMPRSIFEVPGAETCAIEFCSFSKTAGFTGLRCGYTVIPAALERDGQKLQKLWLRRQSTKYNGTSYVVQRAAAAVLTEEGQRQTREAVDYYRENARILAGTLERLGISYTGGKNSPYVWLRCPGGITSWEYFDFLLERAGVVGTPGAGFGAAGEGCFRLTAFGRREDTLEAAQRLLELGC